MRIEIEFGGGKSAIPDTVNHVTSRETSSIRTNSSTGLPTLPRS